MKFKASISDNLCVYNKKEGGICKSRKHDPGQIHVEIYSKLYKCMITEYIIKIVFVGGLLCLKN